mgnify:CR=1 FL=1
MSYECQELQSVANDDSYSLEERDEAAEQLEKLAGTGDAHAQHIIGTAYRDGGLLIPDTSGSRRRETTATPMRNFLWNTWSATNSARPRLCWRPHGYSTTWAISSGTTHQSLLPPAFKSTVSGCRSSNANASPSATSRTTMNSNHRDIRCSSVDSLNAKGATRRAYFAPLKSIKLFQKRTAVTKEDARKSNSFLRGFVICVVATKKGVIPYG